LALQLLGLLSPCREPEPGHSARGGTGTGHPGLRNQQLSLFSKAFSFPTFLAAPALISVWTIFFLF